MVDDRITKSAPYGQHIALTCRNHPELRWSTKNIMFIGARSIFFDLLGQNPTTQECACPASDLIVAPEVLNAPEVAQ